MLWSSQRPGHHVITPDFVGVPSNFMLVISKLAGVLFKFAGVAFNFAQVAVSLTFVGICLVVLRLGCSSLGSPSGVAFCVFRTILGAS